MYHIVYGFGQKIRMDEFSNKTACVTRHDAPELKKLNRYSCFLMDGFSSKTDCVTPKDWNFEKKLDEFSSETAWKIKISEKFLDEFSMFCQ